MEEEREVCRIITTQPASSHQATAQKHAHGFRRVSTMSFVVSGAQQDPRGTRACGEATLARVQIGPSAID
eukprot:6190326-Pleurochrysis_carterae.AAC.1